MEPKQLSVGFGKGETPTSNIFHIFGSKCYILEDREQRRKIDLKSYEGIFLRYSINSKAYKVYKYRTKTMMESINVFIDDTPEEKKEVEDEDDVSP